MALDYRGSYDLWKLAQMCYLGKGHSCQFISHAAFRSSSRVALAISLWHEADLRGHREYARYRYVRIANPCSIQLINKQRHQTLFRPCSRYYEKVELPSSPLSSIRVPTERRISLSISIDILRGLWVSARLTGRARCISHCFQSLLLITPPSNFVSSRPQLLWSVFL